MSSRKQRERLKRMAFDRAVEANRKIADLSKEKPAPKDEPKPKKKPGRKPKKTGSDAK